MKIIVKDIEKIDLFQKYVYKKYYQSKIRARFSIYNYSVFKIFRLSAKDQRIN